MLTYITLFVVCVILAVVIRFVFKAVSESSHSLSTSKTQIEIIHSTPANKKAKAVRHTATGTATRSGQTSQVTTQNRARRSPTEKVDWGWQGSGVQVREPQHATSVGASSHCSLYDASIAEPKENHNQNVGWPYREEMPSSGGKSYKIKRKEAPKTPEPETVGKPWGW